MPTDTERMNFLEQHCLRTAYTQAPGASAKLATVTVRSSAAPGAAGFSYDGATIREAIDNAMKATTG